MNADSLAALRDLHAPAAPWLWSVPDWVIAAVLAALLGLAWSLVRYLRRRRLHAALHELAIIEAAYASDANATRLVRGLSRLLRRYAVARFPQAGVEGLTGDDWARFLSARCRGFDATIGDTLAVRPYQTQGDIDADALIRQVRRWMKVNPQ